MKGIIFICLVIFLGCKPQDRPVTEANKAQCCGPHVSEVTLLVANQKEVTIRGKYLDEIVRVKFKNENFEKSFRVKSRSFEKLVLEAIDLIKIPVDVAMEMVLSSAWADNSFPVLFSLQPDAVEAINIKNGAATRLKLNKEPTDSPNDGDVLAWDSNSSTFKFTSNSGGGDGGPSNIPKICRIEYRLDSVEFDGIVPFIDDVAWDSGGPYGSDCEWLIYGSSKPDSMFYSDSYIEEFSLDPGTYLIDVWTAFQKCDSSWIDIYNVTENRQEIQGSTHYGRFNTEVDTTYQVKTTVNLTARTLFKIRSFASSERCTTSAAGAENSYELNGQITIWKFN